MGRSESHQAAEQGMTQSAQDQANATKALAATNQDLQNYSNNVNNFMRFGRQTYGANGEFMRDQNTIANTTAAAGANSIAGSLASNAMKTGQNTAGYATALGRAQNTAEQNMTSQLANADASRLQQLTNINQQGVQMSALPAQVQAGLYGTGTSGAGNQLSSAANAAKTPGFLDTFLPALVGGASAVGAAAVKGGGGCWIAAELYGGWFEPETIAIRKWLLTQFTKRWHGRVLMALYAIYGRRVARALPKHRVMRAAFQWLFDSALAKAKGETEC